MPSPKDKAKATGDTHLPEVEPEDLPLNDARPEGADTEGEDNLPRSDRRAGVGKKGDEPA
jgi:hypothetical protein